MHEKPPSLPGEGRLAAPLPRDVAVRADRVRGPSVGVRLRSRAPLPDSGAMRQAIIAMQQSSPPASGRGGNDSQRDFGLEPDLLGIYREGARVVVRILRHQA